MSMWWRGHLTIFLVLFLNFSVFCRWTSTGFHLTSSSGVSVVRYAHSCEINAQLNRKKKETDREPTRACKKGATQSNGFKISGPCGVRSREHGTTVAGHEWDDGKRTLFATSFPNLAKLFYHPSFDHQMQRRRRIRERLIPPTPLTYRRALYFRLSFSTGQGVGRDGTREQTNPWVNILLVTRRHIIQLRSMSTRQRIESHYHYRGRRSY